MRFSPVLRFLTPNGFYVHVKNRTPNWQPLLSEGEKVIGYPSSLQSLVNLKYLFNEEVSTLVGYLRKLVGTQHPLLKLASNMFESPPKAAHARSVLILLISKAAGLPKKNYPDDLVKHGIHEHQRQLAELIEMINLGILGHRGIVDIEKNQSDLEQGNKLAVLGGDYLLSQASGKLAEFRKPEVVETIGKAIADLSKAEFYLKDKNSISSLNDWYHLTSLSVVNLMAAGCRASLQLVDHPVKFQNEVHDFCRHFLFGSLIYNEICQFSTSTNNESKNATFYGMVPFNRSFPYALSNRSSESHIDEQILDQCRIHCLNETNKASDLLSKNFDKTCSATRILRSMIEQIEMGLKTKSVL